MLYSIKNDYLSVTVNSRGAELWSIKDADGAEYLWQGDVAYWSDRSPTLFPYIGRMINKKYSYKGNTYSMDIHGFALSMEFQALSHSENEVSLQLKSSEQTKRQYPWDFTFHVIYRLDKNKLQILFKVVNNDSATMLFAVGGHPGFFVPFGEGERFEDYNLRFPDCELPKRIIFTEDCFVDHMEPYQLHANNVIPLHHSLFDRDAIVLKNAGKTVILENPQTKRSITVTFPQMDYIGFWHVPKTDAPYVCIEPWSSLPSAKGKNTVWDGQEDLLKLEACKTYENEWSITIN